MVLLLGSDAYSPFRLDALRDAIAKAAPGLGPLSIDAKWVYALELADAPIDSRELARAAELLNAEGSCDGADFYVMPRKGTISPWSSKATDIFRNCGLKSILRVERGIRFFIDGAGPYAPHASHVSHAPEEQAQPRPGAIALPPAARAALHD